MIKGLKKKDIIISSCTEEEIVNAVDKFKTDMYCNKYWGKMRADKIDNDIYILKQKIKWHKKNIKFVVSEIMIEQMEYNIKKFKKEIKRKKKEGKIT